MFDWNDLRYFLALARHHSTIAAGRALGVNQSTVQRRIAELENRIGRPLVQRHPTGYQLTEFGEQMLQHAESIERAVSAFEQCVEEVSRDHVGVVRVTCPEPIIYRITESKIMERFTARYPKFRVEFVMSDKYIDLAKGEADVALRSGDTSDDVLVGRKIADSFWAVYASKKYIEQHGQPEHIEDIGKHLIVGFDETMANHRAVAWLQDVAPNATIIARNNSVLGIVYAVKASVGIAPLPTAIGDSEVDLVRVLGPIPELARSWRLLAHPDVRHTPRVTAFFKFINEELSELKTILTG